jgi:predicted ABC-type ATPase
MFMIFDAGNHYLPASMSFKSLIFLIVYFWLSSPEFARQQVAKRVQESGHNIPFDVTKRRYHRNIHNLVNLYVPVFDY